MKIKELIDKLKQYPDDFEVVLYKDDKNNDFNVLEDIEFGLLEDGKLNYWVQEDGNERALRFYEANAIALLCP